MRPTPEELRSMSLFAELEPLELEQLASWFDVEERDSGATLLREGASGYAFYVLRDGTAAVIQGNQEIRELGSGGLLWRAVDNRRRPPYGDCQGNIARHDLEHVRNGVQESRAAVPRTSRQDPHCIRLGAATHVVRRPTVVSGCLGISGLQHLWSVAAQYPARRRIREDRNDAAV